MRNARTSRAAWIGIGVTVMLIAALCLTWPRTEPGIPALELARAGRPFPNRLTLEWPPDLGRELPPAVLVFRAEPGPSGLNRVRELGRLFDIQSEPFGAEGRFHVTAGDRRCWVNQDGTFSYVDDARWPLRAIGLQLTTDELADLASGYLRSRDLLPVEFSVWAVEPATISYGDEPDEHVVGWTVMFRRELNGLPVLGVSRISVDITEIEGQPVVVGVSNYWRSMTPYKELPLKDIADAIDELHQGLGAIDMPEQAISAQIDRVSLAYWEHPVVEQQPYLQPVYHFEGRARLADGSEQPFSGSVPALHPSATAQPPTPKASLPAPVVPRDLPVEAYRMSGGNREPMAELAVAAFAPALSQALSGAEVALLGQGSYDSVLDKMAVADSVSVLDMAYPQPVQIAIKLDRVDRDTTVDSSGRTVLTADRLIVSVQGDYVYLGCLSGQDDRGRILGWRRSSQTHDLERLGMD